ncbi:MAG: long-chain fatty acid--CoA ligase [Deltaproteobacteria bacterium]|nr:long-chain fatty acid--CoA ligase [Deltaproteobacteria bacterium]MBI2364000.1 long-chain fatty acid--CoA ligase [Deltaproteobacteria bacterium]MBI2533836.1 long-chain fatty acid--CoA ligase [Deltaproteobacteria bacterium]MBI3066643.1 long-chain fatty acid--CoA ligase [Deltaproteobacteria bacterium]
MNIFDSLERSKSYLPDKEAVIFGATGITYRDLYERVCRLSSTLQADCNIQQGDRVALFLPNVPDFIFSYYAVVRLGAIAVSLNVMFKRDELKFILNDSEAKLLITTPQLLEQVPEASDVPALKTLLCTGKADRAGVVELSKLLSSASPPTPKSNVGSDSAAAILYTSGTTGKPKGVVLSQGNLISNVYATHHHTRMVSTDRLICYLPLFHCFGQNFIMNASVNAGATLVLHERFQPDEIVDSIKANAVTMFFGVPTVYSRFLTLPNLEDPLRTVRYYFTAAAPMPVGVARRWRERFDAIIYEGYGLTETSPFASYNHDFVYREGSVGSPIENVEMKIVDPEGHDLPQEELGEITIKGPNVMQGYFRRPEETAQVMREGWFLTGDIGQTDADGYFYLVDRAKDMINVAGFKVWPREVEELLMKHPAVAEAAVIGIPDPDSGEAVKAFAVLKAGAPATEQELTEFCRTRIAVYKAPRFVEFIDALPRNPSGKILKRELRARERNIKEAVGLTSAAAGR